MASIAYITDPNMLEMHRLHGRNTMNFWRLSSKVNFKNFSEGDLVFFLSKDKDKQRGKEKGIVGYGRLDSIHVNSVNYLWKKYQTENGYSTLESFKEAIIKVSKNHELPNKISSLYLTDVLFYQSPIYLSECGMNISGNIESFIYLNPEVTLKLLNTKVEPDMFFESNGGKSFVDKHKLEFAIALMQDSTSELKLPEAKLNKAKRELSKYIEVHPEYSFIRNSKTSIKKVIDEEVTILIYNHKSIDYKLIIGQASLYKHYLYMYYPNIKKLSFETIDDNLKLERIINY